MVSNDMRGNTSEMDSSDPSFSAGFRFRDSGELHHVGKSSYNTSWVKRAYVKAVPEFLASISLYIGISCTQTNGPTHYHVY
jgi:hypothetical protein